MPADGHLVPATATDTTINESKKEKNYEKSIAP